jgi:hypothetical protein
MSAVAWEWGGYGARLKHHLRFFIFNIKLPAKPFFPPKTAMLSI